MLYVLSLVTIHIAEERTLRLFFFSARLNFFDWRKCRPEGMCPSGYVPQKGPETSAARLFLHTKLPFKISIGAKTSYFKVGCQFPPPP